MSNRLTNGKKVIFSLIETESLRIDSLGDYYDYCLDIIAGSIIVPVKITTIMVCLTSTEKENKIDLQIYTN